MFPRIATAFLISTSALAQTWVPPRGTVSMSIGIQHTAIDSHTMDDGRKVSDLDVRANTLTLGIDYGLTDRLALGVSLPYASSQYRGTSPHPGITDNGAVHETLQDLQIDLRYAAFEGLVSVTPDVSWTQPSRDYETMGHAAAGRGLEELQLGVSVGGEVPTVPGLFVGGRGAYTFVEQVDSHISGDRTNVEFQMGYAVAPGLFVRVFSAWQNTPDGLTLPLTAQAREHYFHEHDRLLKVNYLRGGAGISVALTHSVDAYISYAEVLQSENAHSGSSIALGTSWSFSPRTFLARRNAIRSAASQSRRRANTL